ncbi:unnamed protein product, partial [Brassica rapa subsp. trilocularis]
MGGRCKVVVVTPLIRFWEARNIKGCDLIGVDMVLLDEKSSLIQ